MQLSTSTESFQSLPRCEEICSAAASVSPVVSKKIMMSRSISSSSTLISMKRSRTQAGSFDFKEVTKASQSLEDSISFPTIEWPELDDEIDQSVLGSCNNPPTLENEDEDDDTCTFSCRPPPFKRRCPGLSRSHTTFNLSSLMGESERRGSSGSLC